MRWRLQALWCCAGSLEDRRDIIAIDPGHGGEDPGASGPEVCLKKVVLDIARRLEQQLRGIRVLAIPDADW